MTDNDPCYAPVKLHHRHETEQKRTKYEHSY